MSRIDREISGAIDLCSGCQECKQTARALHFTLPANLVWIALDWFALHSSQFLADERMTRILKIMFYLFYLASVWCPPWSTMVHPQGQAPRHRLLSQREVPTRAGQSATSLAVAGQSWDVGTSDELSDLGMSDIFLRYLGVFMISLEIFGDLGKWMPGCLSQSITDNIQQSCSMSEVAGLHSSRISSVISDQWSRSILREGTAAGCTYALARRQFRTRSSRQVAEAATVAMVAMAPCDSADVTQVVRQAIVQMHEATVRRAGEETSWQR